MTARGRKVFAHIEAARRNAELAEAIAEHTLEMAMRSPAQRRAELLNLADRVEALGTAPAIAKATELRTRAEALS